MLSSAHDMEITLRSSRGSALCTRPSQPKFQHVWGWVLEAPFLETVIGNWWGMENILPGWYDHAPVMAQIMYLWAVLVGVRCCCFALGFSYKTWEMWWESEEGNCIHYTNSSLSTCRTLLVKHTKKIAWNFQTLIPGPKTYDIRHWRTLFVSNCVEALM